MTHRLKLITSLVNGVMRKLPRSIYRSSSLIRAFNDPVIECTRTVLQLLGVWNSDTLYGEGLTKTYVCQCSLSAVMTYYVTCLLGCFVDAWVRLELFVCNYVVVSYLTD